MKILSKFLSIVSLLLLAGLFLLPMSIHAQDESAAVATEVPADPAPILVIPVEEIPNDANLPLMYGVVGVLGLLLVGAMIYSSTITRYLATLVPPETASAIYASGVRFGLQVALNQAAQTPGTLDDEFFVEMARLRGLTVTKRIDGTYDVIQSQNHSVPTMPV